MGEGESNIIINLDPMKIDMIQQKLNQIALLRSLILKSLNSVLSLRMSRINSELSFDWKKNPKI